MGITYLKEKRFADSVDAFIKANNPSYFEELINLNKEVQQHEKML